MVFTAGILLAVLAAAPAQEDPHSLIASAKRHGGTAVNSHDVELPVTPITSLVRDAQVVVRGRVSAIKAVLSNDERDVMTKYTISPTHSYKAPLHTATRPGPTQSAPLCVVVTGGRLDVDGLHLGTDVDIYPANELPLPGDDVILFLVPSQAMPGCFRLLGGPFGAFRVAEGMVIALTKEAQRRRGDQPERMDHFERRIGGAG